MNNQIDVRYQEYANNLIQRFVCSNVSTSRFCNNLGIRKVEFREASGAVKKNCPSLYQDAFYQNMVMEQNKDEKIKEEVLTILNIISAQNGKQLSSLDFFLNTRYSVTEVLQVIDTYFSNSDANLLHHHISPIRNELINVLSENRIMTYLQRNISTIVDNQIVELTMEDKQNILEYIESNALPFTDKIFQMVSYRLMNEKKQNIK